MLQKEAGLQYRNLLTLMRQLSMVTLTWVTSSHMTIPSEYMSAFVLYCRSQTTSGAILRAHSLH